MIGLLELAGVVLFILLLGKGVEHLLSEQFPPESLDAARRRWNSRPGRDRILATACDDHPWLRRVIPLRIIPSKRGDRKREDPGPHGL